MAAPATRTFKVTVNDDVRRFRLASPVTLPSLWSRVHGFVGDPSADLSSMVLQWVDEDGDRISIVDDNDLSEALAYFETGAVRLHLLKRNDATPRDTPSSLSLASAPSVASSSNVSREPSASASATAVTPPPPPPTTTTSADDATPIATETIQDDVTATNADGGDSSASSPSGAEKDTRDATNDGDESDVVHHYISCDATGQYPLRGTRWHRIGDNYDVCQAAFDKLAEVDKRRYERIEKPGDAPVPYRGPVLHFNVTCDATGQCPLEGHRWHKIGENYDLCDAAFQALPEDEKRRYEGIAHPGALPLPYATSVRFNPLDADVDMAKQAAHILQTVMSALHTGYDIEVGLVPRENRPHAASAPAAAGCPRSSYAAAAGGAAPPPPRCGRGGPHGHHHGRHHRHDGNHHGRRGFHHHHGGPFSQRGWRKWVPAWADAEPVREGTVLPDTPVGPRDFGPGVEQLQRFLIAHGLMHENAIRFKAGFFGPRTSKALKDFKEVNQISDGPADCVLDDVTRRALLTLAGTEQPVSPPEPPRDPPRDVERDTVEVQSKPPQEPTAPPATDETPSDTHNSDDAARQTVPKWERERVQLALMGFGDDARIVPLLEAYNGEINKVVTELLEQ